MKTIYWLSIASFLSLVLSIGVIVYLCEEGGCYGIKNISFGDASVSVLGVIVGLLVGWQITNAITIDKKIDKINEITSKIVEEKIKDYDHHVEAVTKQLYGIVLLAEGRNNDALDSFIEGLEEASKSSHQESIVGILSFIEGMEEDKRRVDLIPIKTSNRYIGILQNLNIEDANRYINYIRSKEEKNR